MSATLKTNFAVLNKYEAFYTKGKIQVSKDGKHMFCGCGNHVKVVEVQSGKTVKSIGREEDEEVTSFMLSPDDQYLIVATRHLVLRQWNWKENILLRSWKAIHNGPISCMDFDNTSTLLATGGSDSTIKIWDIVKQYCTHNLKGHQGVVSIVKFHPDISKLQLFSSADDYKMRVWDLTTSRCTSVIEAHYSVVTSIQFSCDGNTMFSGGRDSILSVWDLTTLKVKKTVPVYEPVESLVLLPEDKLFPDLNVESKAYHVITAGNKGILQIWNAETSVCIYTQQEAIVPLEDSEEVTQNITQVVYHEELKSLFVVTFDHNILLFTLEDLQLTKQFAGYNEDILDVQFFGEEDTHLVVATNSNQLKVFEIETGNCQILHGHTDTVLGVSIFKKQGSVMASCSKDNTIRMWKYDEETGQVNCVAVGQGHTHAIGAVTFFRSSLSYVLSGSADCTLKLWAIESNLALDSVETLHAKRTQRGHDKDINSMAVAPNDKLLATGSQDRTAKLWSLPNLSLVGVMKGHKRGIWCVEFSPVDQCLATSSADGTIKFWSVTDFSCVKSFEGHDCSVLKVTFVCRGMQMLSCGSDGLIKLWTIKSNECVKTFDEHEEKIWSVACNRAEDKFVSGGADSAIILWKDVTELEIQEARTKRDNLILQEQELSNLLHHKKYLKAIGLAITLEQPFRVLNIMKEVLSQKDGSKQLEGTLSKLRMDQLDAVLRFSVQWNTNSKHCHVAQFVINSMLKSYSEEELLKFPNMKSTLEGLLPYTDRHFQRMNRLLQQSMFVEYTWQCMRRVTGDRIPLGMSYDSEDAVTGVDNSDEDGEISVSESSEMSEEVLESKVKTKHMVKQKKILNGIQKTVKRSLEEETEEINNNVKKRLVEDSVMDIGVEEPKGDIFDIPHEAPKKKAFEMTGYKVKTRKDKKLKTLKKLKKR